MTPSPVVDDTVVDVFPVDAHSLGARIPGTNVAVTRVGGLVLLLIGLAGAGVALAGLAGAARQAPWVVLRAAPWALASMLAAMIIGYLMQTLSLRSLIAQHLPSRELLMLPWACASVNRVTPGGTGGLLLTTKVLHRRGVSYAGAAVYMASVGISHTLSGLLLLGIAVGAGGMPGSYGIPLGGPGWALSFLGLISLGVLVCVPRTRAKALDMVRRSRHELSLRRLPLVVLLQAGARLAPAVVLAGALVALGQSVSFATVVAIVVVASATGSLIPLPGGGGGVELALTGLLTASGVSLGAASSAVLVARLVGFWLPAAMGLPALISLRRTLAATDLPTDSENAENPNAEVILLEPILVPIAAVA